MMVKVLVIGLGDIAMGYDLGRKDVTWSHIGAINNHPHFQVVAGIDPDIETHNKFRKLTDAKAYSHLEVFLQSNHDAIDLVVIASPTHCHIQDYKLVKSLSVKLVLMEKPLVAPGENIEKFMSEIESGPRVLVNLFRLYQSQINTVLQDIAKHGPSQINIRYSKTIEHSGIHFITLIIRHFGSCLAKRLVKVSNEVVHSFTF